MSTLEFAEVVRAVTRESYERLIPAADAFSGQDMRSVALWLSSFVLSWAEGKPSGPRVIVASILRKAAEAVERGEAYN